MGNNNDSPTYRIHDSTNGKILSSRNVTFIECMKSFTPSMYGDINEGSKSSDDLQKVCDGMQNLESTVVSDNIEGNHSPVQQYNRMTLRSSKEKVMGICQEKKP